YKIQHSHQFERHFLCTKRRHSFSRCNGGKPFACRYQYFCLDKEQKKNLSSINLASWKRRSPLEERKYSIALLAKANRFYYSMALAKPAASGMNPSHISPIIAG